MLAVRLWTRLGHRVLVEKRTTAGLVERWVILESRPPCVVCLSFSHHSQISNVSRVPRQSFFVPASSRTFRVVSEIIWTGRVRSCSPLGHSPLYTVGGVGLLWVAVSPRYGNGRYSSIAGQWSSMSKPPRLRLLHPTTGNQGANGPLLLNQQTGSPAHTTRRTNLRLAFCPRPACHLLPRP